MQRYWLNYKVCQLRSFSRSNFKNLLELIQRKKKCIWRQGVQKEDNSRDT